MEEPIEEPEEVDYTILMCRLSQYFSRLTHNFSLAFEQKTTPLKTGSAT